MSPSIRWRIAVPYIFLILLAMAGLFLYLSDLVRDTYLDSLEAQLTSEACLIGDALASPSAWGQPDGSFDPLVWHYADLLGTRVTIIGADGTVLGESHEDRTQMDNHLYRPEVQQALSTGRGSSIRYSQTVKYEMMYAAVPVTIEGTDGRPSGVVGIARVALSLHQIEANVARLRSAILAATLLAALSAAVASCPPSGTRWVRLPGPSTKCPTACAAPSPSWSRNGLAWPPCWTTWRTVCS
jgi:two-component system phosphate regulon sensor histidine kinase PhoR